MFGTADPGPRIAFLGSFGGLRPFGAELASTAFGLACQQMKQAGTLTNEQSSESAHGARDSTYQQNTTNIGRKPVEITAQIRKRIIASSPEQPAAAGPYCPAIRSFIPRPFCIGDRRRTQGARSPAHGGKRSGLVLPLEWTNGGHSSDFADLKAVAVDIGTRGVIGNTEQDPSLQHTFQLFPASLQGLGIRPDARDGGNVAI
jgi:hypothetical protein